VAFNLAGAARFAENRVACVSFVATSSLVLLLCLGLLVGESNAARAADMRAAGRPDTAAVFDIPPQSLPKALDAFSAITGIEVLVDARNAEGRQSPRVRGVMTAQQALKILLAESQLFADEFTPGTVTLMRIPERRDAQATLIASAHQAYFAAIQRAIQRALCQAPETAPGNYRLALRLRIGADGLVSQWKLLDTTGNASRDRAFEAVLTALDIGDAPPIDLPQPVAVVILPHMSQDLTNCPITAVKMRRAFN
jgi:hypothetical protein